MIFCWSRSLGLAIFTQHPIYVLAFWAQAALYGMALLHLVPGLGKTKPIYLAYYFCLSNVAALLGTISFFRGEQFVTCQRERA